MVESGLYRDSTRPIPMLLWVYGDRSGQQRVGYQTGRKEQVSGELLEKIRSGKCRHIETISFAAGEFVRAIKFVKRKAGRRRSVRAVLESLTGSL